MKIFIDPGHGGTDSGATGNGLKEKDLTLAIALRVKKLLENNYSNAIVRMSRTNDQTVSLAKRTSDANAWGADFYLSIHINAGGGTGYEDYIYDKVSASSRSEKLRDIVHVEIIKVNELKNRGKKKADFHVLRESKMPAMLTENGFIDNVVDAAKMKTASWLDKVASGHAAGVAKALGLISKSATPKPEKSPYAVVMGLFCKEADADEQAAALQSKGIAATVQSASLNGKDNFRVVAGVYMDKPIADQRVNDLKKAGVDALILLLE